MQFSKIRLLLKGLRTTPLHPQWLVLRGEAQNRRAIARSLRGRILDIGCGNRPMEALLGPDTAYVGLDYPTTHAKGYAGRPDVFGDGQSLPFGAECFDVVVALDVLEHLPAPDQCVQEARRALRGGGQLILQTPFLYPLHDLPHDFQRWTLPGLEALVQRQGFAVTERRVFGNPCETAAALTAISLAKAVLDSMAHRSPVMLLIPLFVVGIPVVNLLGWLLARLLPADDFMPLGYRLVCTKDV
ncbi:MAG: class I SAM-dependent methyltransferase [Candidatus Competibacter sp.]|nr:class I SAM-dependent methyltransferase [Candidatus Competibacter sp.]